MEDQTLSRERLFENEKSMVVEARTAGGAKVGSIPNSQKKKRDLYR